MDLIVKKGLDGSQALREAGFTDHEKIGAAEGGIWIFTHGKMKGGHREVAVTNHRKKPDFAKEMKRVIELSRYRNAARIHVVLDNLNTHFEKSFRETFGRSETNRIMNRIQFHYTPKHASWLNMAEIEISILDRQCIRGRIPTEEKLTDRINFWKTERNKQKATISWKFTVKDARIKFKYSEPAELN